MTKRFTISIDSNDRKSLWDDERTEEEPLICLNRYGEIWGIDDCCKLLNELNQRNHQLEEEIKDFQTLLASREEVYIKPIIRTIEEAYENERTQIGKNVLKQLLEAIQ